ncbi:MAG: hypothetical protein JXA35_07355, partial [Deltaproteobacteria bacterium]|nr:hypothetical protein [Deltaproteobacteria bacterium]
RLKGEWVEARIYAEHIDIWYGQKKVERLPVSYTEIMIHAYVCGSNPGSLFGINWYGPVLYDSSKMSQDIEDYLNFRKNNYVPIMCLEFGVIMNATEEQGHVKWMNDFLRLMAQHNIHWAYHSWRSYSETNTSFGIYQCWDEKARDCPNAGDFIFILPVLHRYMGPTISPGILNLLLN